MPDLISLNWDGFSRGEDSEGYAIDPLGIANGYASVMENLEPRSGKLRPRYGSSLKLEGNFDVTWMGEYQKDGGGYALILDSHVLYGININSGNKFIIRDGWNLDNAAINTCRIGVYLVVCVDSTDQSMVIYEKQNQLYWFSCVLNNSGNPFSSFTGKLCDDSGAEVSDPTKYNGNSSGPFNVTKPRDLTTTFVRLAPENDNVEFTLSDGEPGALAESYEDQAARLKLDYIKWGKYSFSGTVQSIDTSYGADLVSGDDYSVGGGWYGNASSGFIHASGSNNAVTGSTTFTVGKKYRVNVYTSGVVSGSVFVRVAGSTVTVSASGTNTRVIKSTSAEALFISPSVDFSGTVRVTVELQTTTYTCSLNSDGDKTVGLMNGYKVVSGTETSYISTSEYVRTQNDLQIWKITLDEEYDITVSEALSISQASNIEYRTDGMGNLYVTVSSSASIPSGATHVRIYMTLPATVTNSDFSSAQTIADGLYLRWLADIPVYKIVPGAVLKISTTDGYLNGSTNLCWSTGRDDFPGGSCIVFGGGRLWVGSRSNGGNPGRVMASETMDGATVQLAKALSFDYANDFIDTSTDESEATVGLGISQGDLIVFNKRSVWRQPECNIDKFCTCISRTHGAIGAVTEVNQQIFYLSVNGPAVVSGSVLELFKAMKSSRTSKVLYGSSSFYTKGAKLRGIYHNDSWIVSDGKSNACYLMRGDSTGTWALTTTANMSLSCSCYPTKGVCWVGGKSSDIYSLMEKGIVKDGAHPFKARLYTNATKVPKGIECAEAFSILADLHWTDSGRVGIALYGDYTRLENIYDFAVDQRAGMAVDVDKIQYGPVMQGVRAGAMSHWFLVGIEKWILSSDTLFGPVRLNLIPRNYHPETISLSVESQGGEVADNGFFGFDQDFTEE